MKLVYPGVAPAPSRRSFQSLAMTCSVLTVESSALDAAERYLRDELNRLDRACSRFRSDSELEQVQRSGGERTPISRLLAEVVAASIETARFTNSVVDPTVGNSLITLGYDRDFGEVASEGPPLERSLEPAPGWRTIELNLSTLELRVPDGVRLDLGASAKAFAADRAARRIAEGLGTGVLVNLAGDIAVAGAPPPNGWQVGLAADSALPPEQTDVVVAVRSGGLASSGVGVRSWRRGDREVHHIIDPRTGDTPLPRWSLVTVAASTCLLANGAATASIVLGDDAPAWLARTGLPARLVDVTGAVLAINGWPTDT